MGEDQAEGARSSDFRSDIQGLRAIAVVAVVLYHAGVAFLPGGYVGVDVFFVISGFLITSHLLNTLARHGRIGLANFYAKRARRILPASFVVVVLTVVAALLWYPPLLMREVWQGAVATGLYAPNILFAVDGTNYLAETTPSLFQHYWSLGVEEQFYLVWPLLLALGWRFLRSRRALFVCLVLLVLMSFTLGALLTYRSQPWAFFSLPTRAWELGVGGLVAFALSRRSQPLTPRAAAAAGWVGIGGIVSAVVLFGADTPFPSYWAAVPVASTALVILAGATPSSFGPATALSVRPMQFLGLISYSLYLVHWPALVVPDVALGGLPLWLSLAIAAVCVSVAWGMYRFVETPGRTFAPLARARPRRSLWLSLASSVVVIALASGAYQYSKTVPLYTADEAEAAAPLIALPAGTTMVPANLTPSLRMASADQPVIYSDGCHLRFDETEAQGCAFGNLGGPEIVLFGDSHAAQWFPAILEFATANGYRLQVYRKAACPVADLAVLLEGVPYSNCDTWRQNVIDRINADAPELVVVSSYSGSVFESNVREPSSVWREALETTLESVVPESVLIADTSHTDTTPSVCLSAHLSDALACSIPMEAAFNAGVSRAEEEAAAHTGTRLLDFTTLICSATTCPAIIGNVLVYRDEHHLTATFVEALSDAVADALQGALA